MFDLGKTIDATGTAAGRYRGRTLRDRVRAKIRIDPVTGCHIWTGAKSQTRRGYRPVIQIGGRGTRVVRVHRLVLEWKEGPPPSPLHEAGHTCPHGEHELCVNEEHLTWQTRTENEHSKTRSSSSCTSATKTTDSASTTRTS